MILTEKELSWLNFNERVLQEAADSTVPLIERVRFLGIYSSNTDEFYRVQFADVKRRVLMQKGVDEQSKHLLNNIQSRVLNLNQEFDKLCIKTIEELRQQKIYMIDELSLDKLQQQWLLHYFKDEILPLTVPIILNDEVNLLDFLKDEYTYLAIEMINKEHRQYALIEVPTDKHSRFIQLPNVASQYDRAIILLEDAIRFNLNEIFKGLFEYDELKAYAMKMTRDAEYDLTQEVEQSLLEQMSDSIDQRLTALPVRFVYQREMPPEMLQDFSDWLELSPYDSIIASGRVHNFKDFISFPNIGGAHLTEQALQPLVCHQFAHAPNVFEAVKQSDILLYYPYHSFSYMIEWVRQAAYCPKVKSIRMIIYRVAKQSRIMEALIDAANNGKRVTVVVELQARFDEEANIEWARRLTEAHVQVVFGVPGLKIHSKLCLIEREENNELARYAYIGTGNFNEKTATVYSDFALFTHCQEIALEVQQVFQYIINPYKPVKFKHLMVSPRNSRQRLYGYIDNEISLAQQGSEASILLKVNNLVDEGLIARLYQASQAGVNIQLIVRGMCSLVPGVEQVSERIKVISIVDRFLEHARVAVFHNNGDNQIMISSADWMTRNIDRRIEVGCPIWQPDLKKMLLDILNIQLSDNVKARIINKEMSNAYVSSEGGSRRVRSQIDIYHYLAELEESHRYPNAPVDQGALE